MSSAIVEREAIVAALDRPPLNRRHKIFLVALLGALMFDYMKPYTISFVIPGMRAMWGLTEAEAAYLPVAGLGGTTLGALFWGFVADRIGRRTTLLWTIGIFSVASLCGFALEYEQSLFACFVMGFGVGGETPIVFALASEYLPVRARGAALLLIAIVGATGGYVLAAVVATVSNAALPAEQAWRWMWLFGLLPAALVLVLRRRVIPESARYLLSKGRVVEARAAAESMVGPIEATPAEPQPAGAADPSPLASPPRGLRARSVALAFFSFAWGIASFGFVTWLPTLLARLGYSGAVSSGYLALSALIALPALGFTAVLLRRIGTRRTLAAYAVGGGAALVVVGAAADQRIGAAFLVAGIAFGLLFVTSIGGVFSFYAAEVFPTSVRGRLSGTVAAAGKAGAIVGPYFGGVWLGAGGSALGLQLPLAGALLAAAAVLVLAGVETTGRSLEEIGAR